QPERFSAGYILTPNYSGLVYFADHGVALTILPQSVDRTQLLCEWYVHEDAVEGDDYEVERLIGAFHQTNLEDTALAARNQLGMNSIRFVPGPNSPRREPRIKDALNRYLELLDDAR